MVILLHVAYNLHRQGDVTCGGIRMLKNFILNHTSIPSLAKGMDVYALREKVISTNIANIQTPGYNRLQVDFEEHLKAAVVNSISNGKTHDRHFAIGQTRSIGNAHPHVKADPDGDLKSGINNVSVEEEMVELVKNQVRFMYATRMVSRDFAALRSSITGRHM